MLHHQKRAQAENKTYRLSACAACVLYAMLIHGPEFTGVWNCLKWSVPFLFVAVAIRLPPGLDEPVYPSNDRKQPRTLPN